MPGCLGALTLGYYHCNKEPGQPVGRHALRGVYRGPPVFSFIARTRSDPGDCNATTPVFPRPPSRLQSPLKQRFAPPRRTIHTRSRPPRWGSLYASGPRQTTASRRQARPSGQRCTRQPPDSSFVGDRRPRAFIFSRRGDTCVPPRLDGRRDSPSATLRTRHVSFSHPRPRDR